MRSFTSLANRSAALPLGVPGATTWENLITYSCAGAGIAINATSQRTLYRINLDIFFILLEN
jgi:hypothetical protein